MLWPLDKLQVDATDRHGQTPLFFAQGAQIRRSPELLFVCLKSLGILRLKFATPPGPQLSVPRGSPGCTRHGKRWQEYQTTAKGTLAF